MDTAPQTEPTCIAIPALVMRLCMNFLSPLGALFDLNKSIADTFEYAKEAPEIIDTVTVTIFPTV